MHHVRGVCCLKSIFLADCPHTKPPWLFLLGWYPFGFMMQCKGSEKNLSSKEILVILTAYENLINQFFLPNNSLLFFF
jgi:hypothetical protein